MKAVSPRSWVVGLGHHRSNDCEIGFEEKPTLSTHEEVLSLSTPHTLPWPTVVSMAGVLAALLICSIIGISNGDTLRARCAIEGTPQTITVRPAEVDAPEKAQSYGARSKQNLSALCFGRPADVRPQAAM